MKCNMSGEKLIAFTESKLTTKEAKKVEAHIKNCKQCRESLKDIRSVKEILNKTKDIKMSPVFWDNLYNNIQHKIDRYTRKVVKFTKKQIEFAIGLAFIIMFGILLLWQNPENKSDENNITQETEMGKEFELLLEEHTMTTEKSIIPEFANIDYIPKKKKTEKSYEKDKN